MDELINGLVEKVGINKEQAEGVISFLKENASKLPELMGGGLEDLKDKLPGALGGLFGGD